MIERPRVRIHAGAAGVVVVVGGGGGVMENFLLQGQLSVLTLISVFVPPPCYRSST